MQTTSQLEFTNLINQNTHVIYKAGRAYGQTICKNDDLYQDILLEAWLSFPKFKGKSKFSTWLYAISRNVTINRLRKLKNVKEILVDNVLWEIADAQVKDDECMYDFSIMDRLTESEKTTLNYRLEGLTFDKISELTGEPINRLIVRMHRIKRMLLGKQKKHKNVCNRF